MGDILHAQYKEGASLPDLWVTWRDAAGRLVKFATQPHTFTMTLSNRRTPGTLAFTKTIGFTGFDTDPNVNIGWVPGLDISVLPPGLYDGLITAVRDADHRPRELGFTLRIERKPGSAIDAGNPDPPE